MKEINLTGSASLELKSDLIKGIADYINEIPVFRPFMAGEFYAGGDIKYVRSPIDGSQIAGFYRPEWDAVDATVERVFREGRWAARNTPGEDRAKIIQRIADLMENCIDDLVEVLVINTGKTYRAARGEAEGSIDRLRKATLDLRKLPGDYVPGDWDAHTLESEGLIKREPYGVVFAIVPFNYPLFDTVNKFTYSFLPGNAFVIKPPSADPLPVFYFARLAVEAGVPPESLAVIPIPGRESGKIVSDRRIHVISFTGSSETGAEVIRSAGIKQFIMELGGGDPAFVLDDADLSLAASKIATGITSFSGQRCDAIKIVFVESNVYEDVKKLLVDHLSRFKVGDPRDPETDIGPLIEEVTAIEFENAVEEALNSGGKLLYGGGRWRNYVRPALIEVVDWKVLIDLKVFREEIFAPVAVMTPFDDLDKAIEVANERRYGLDAAIFGRDINRIRKLVRMLDVGAVYVNEYPRHGIGYYPFGGRKDSGIGREGIGYSIEYVTAIKTVVYNYRGKGVWEYM